jgi:oligosaccharide translocation protein RFT1
MVLLDDDATEVDNPVPAVKHDTSSLGTALKTGRSLLLLQLLSRILTFLLNQSLLRLSTPEVLGTASIQFDLISSTILFLSREGIRNALLRRDQPASDQDGSTTSLANKRLACVPLYLGLGVAGVVTSLYLRTSSLGTTSQTDFHAALGMYILAALIELSIEPFYIRCLTSTPPQLSVRVQAEGGMAIAKAVVTFALLYANPRRALLGFGVGQLCGNTVLALRYLLKYGFSDYIWVQTIPGSGDRAPICKYC